MHCFDSLVYLDVHRTGSTFVSTFLREQLGGTEYGLSKHARLPVEQYDPSRLHVISVREPLSQYRSLYAFGLAGHGRLFRHLSDLGFGSLYAGEASFETWLRFILDPGNAKHFLRYARSGAASAIGLFAFRVLTLATVAPLRGLGADPAGFYRRHSIVDRVVHQETLGDDLAELVRTTADTLPWKPEAAAALSTARRRNVSAGPAPEGIDPELVELVRQRDRFVYDEFYPER